VVCVHFSQLVDNCVTSIYNGAHGGGSLKVCSLKVVCVLKWFLAYRYIFKYEMCKYERNQIRESMSTTSRMHKIFTFIPKIALLTLMVLIWIC
jgi:hypothetical protein